MSESNPSGSVTLFISDLHLCPTRPAITGLFCDFLAGAARKADALYILGDLFEYWAGDDDLADPFNAQICAALKGCPTPHYFIPGNRDFLVGPAFAAATGMTLLPDETVHVIAGTPTLLLHGDTLCTDDVDYQAFRLEVRSPAWQQNFLALPLSERKRQIEGLRMRSEQTKSQKSMQLMDTNADAVKNAFRRHQVTRMIHGHTHRLALHAENVDGHACERHVLGDWHDSGNVLRCDSAGCRSELLPLSANSDWLR